MDIEAWLDSRWKLIKAFSSAWGDKTMDTTGFMILGHEDFPKALRALDEVMRVHYPSPNEWVDLDGSTQRACRGCSAAYWPCQTIQVIAAAIEEN